MKIKATVTKIKIFKKSNMGVYRSFDENPIFEKNLIDVNSVIASELFKNKEFSKMEGFENIKSTVALRNKEKFINILNIEDVGEEINVSDYIYIKVENYSFVKSFMSIPLKKKVEIEQVDFNFLTDSVLDNFYAEKIILNDRVITPEKKNIKDHIDTKYLIVRYSEPKDIYEFHNQYK